MARGKKKEPQQKCNECDKVGEVREDNRNTKRCTYCWSINVKPIPQAKKHTTRKKK